ncbi:hypothetical protein AB0N09_36170 [Streptomyces erythrochromogenes]|uniref:hypothetical protein n=1 Tax=Streptomyces erythrochromogenes TaxID=285574 RepID=UPI003427D1FC
MSTPTPGPFFYESQEWFEPSWAYEDHAVERAWWLFEEHLDSYGSAPDGDPGDGLDTPMGGVPMVDDSVLAALDATCAALEELDPRCGPEEARRWLAQTFLDSGLPQRTSPQALLDILIDIVQGHSLRGAKVWYPTESAGPDTDTAGPWFEGPENTHEQHVTPVPGQWQRQWHEWQPGTPRSTSPAAHPAEADGHVRGPWPDMSELTPDQKSILTAVRHDRTVRTVAQICGASGVGRRHVYEALQSLAEGLGIPDFSYTKITDDLRAEFETGGRLAHLTLPPLPVPAAGSPARQRGTAPSDTRRTKRRRTDNEQT